MLSFLNSVALPLLIAAAIPLLIHFFNRRRVKTIPFSSLRFLKMLEHQRIRHVRIYQILLILVRTLFILFLVLAFARPAVRNIFHDSSSSGHTTAVIVLDNSYSMQAAPDGETFFNKAIKALQAVITTFKNGDRVYLLTPHLKPDQSHPLNLQKTNITKTVAVKNYSPDYCPTLKEAAGLLRAQSNVNSEFYFISDFFIPSQTCKDSLSADFFPLSTKVFFIPVAKNTHFNNVGIDTVYLSEQFPEIHKPVTLKVVLRNYSLKAAAAQTVHLFRHNQRLAMQNIEIPAGQTKEIFLRFVPEKPGYQLLKVELDDDDLLTDNTYYLTLRLSGHITVLSVSQNSGSHFQTALQILAAKTPLQIEPVNYALWQGKDFFTYDIILLSDPPAFNPAVTERLSSFLKAGKHVIIVPGKGSNPVRLNLLCRRLINQTPYGSLKNAGDSASYFPLSADFLQIPLFASLFDKTKTPTDLPVVFKYFKLGGKGKTIIRFKNRDAFLRLFPVSSGKGACYLFASGFGSVWTDFSLKGIFVPMLYRLFYSVGQKETQMPAIQTGRNFTLFLPDINQNRHYSLKPPQAERFPLIVQQSPAGLFFEIAALNNPGPYFLFEDGKIKDALSVNVSNKELRRPFVRFGRLFPKHIMLHNPVSIKKTITTSRNGKEFWFAFLALALLMLLTEMFLIRKIEGRRA